MMKVITLLSAIGLASAACPNSCSGHGTCGANEVCSCYDGWGMGGAPGGDCSDRFCPYELAWAGAPNKAGLTHLYSECAGKGVCDRETGQCECFGGFEGKGCGRQSCPDDCSGHGTCEFQNELTFGTVWGDYYDGSAYGFRGLGSGATIPAADASWDADRARACVCDGGWSGINCASRMCASGNDVMDLRANTGVAANAQVQTITLISGGVDGGKTAAADAPTDFNGKSFALTFTSKMNETFTTVPVQMESGNIGTLATNVKNALRNLPNKVINDCAVTGHLNADADALILQVTFSGSSVQGKQHLLEVATSSCGVGCTPSIDGIDDVLVQGINATYNTGYSTNGKDNTHGVGTLSSVKESTASDYNSYECGRRGKCDYDTGLCSCFEGYTGESCTSLTALI